MHEIYCVTNSVNGKKYIGQTNQGHQKRWTAHRQAAKNGKNLYFYSAIRKYGEDVFEIEVVEEVDTPEQADEAEKKWISFYDTTDAEYGYNTMYGGRVSLHTEYSKNKISVASATWWSDPENRQRLSEAHKGKHTGEANPMYGLHGPDHPFFGRQHSDETKAKISSVRKEKYTDPEFKARMSAANTGKHHTEEGKANIAKALMGNQYRKGIPHSDEVKRKISEGGKRAREAKRQAYLDSLLLPPPVLQ